MGIYDPLEKRVLPLKQMNHLHQLFTCETSNVIIVVIDKKQQVSQNRCEEAIVAAIFNDNFFMPQVLCLIMENRKEIMLMFMAAALIGVIGVTVMETMYYVNAAPSDIGQCASALKNASAQLCHNFID